jgi:hypothetical protein
MDELNAASGCDRADAQSEGVNMTLANKGIIDHHETGVADLASVSAALTHNPTRRHIDLFRALPLT